MLPHQDTAVPHFLKTFYMIYYSIDTGGKCWAEIYEEKKRQYFRRERQRTRTEHRIFPRQSENGHRTRGIIDVSIEKVSDCKES